MIDASCNKSNNLYIWCTSVLKGYKKQKKVVICHSNIIFEMRVADKFDIIITMTSNFFMCLAFNYPLVLHNTISHTLSGKNGGSGFSMHYAHFNYLLICN